jgi:hypothetical protein
MEEKIEDRCERLRIASGYTGDCDEGGIEEGEWWADARDVDWESDYLNFCAKTTPAGYTHPIAPPPVYQDKRVVVTQGSHMDAVTALGRITGRELDGSYFCVVKRILKTGECPDIVADLLEHKIGTLPRTPEADDVKRSVILYALHDFPDLREMFACGYIMAPQSMREAWKEKLDSIESKHEKRSTIQLMYDSCVKVEFPFTTRYKAVDHDDMKAFFAECTRPIHNNFLIHVYDSPTEYVDRIMELLSPDEEDDIVSWETMKEEEGGGEKKNGREEKKEGIEGCLQRHRLCW